MELNRFMHENKVGLSVLGIILGTPLAMICVLSLAYSNEDTGLVTWSYDFIGVWAYWVILPALAILIISIYFLYDFIKRLKEFNSLMKIQSKAKFIKNQDRIEELAWRLHPKYERLVVERKKKYKIK